MGSVVHTSALLLMQFSYELLVISNKHRLYLIHSVSQHLRRNHFQYQSLVLYSPHEGQSLNFPFQAQLLIVYYHNVQDLTLHHLVYFFCFRHHHTYTIFSLKYYVVVILALRVPSNSVSLLHGFAPCLHTSFPICLLKFSCNSYSRVQVSRLKSRVFLRYLINSCSIL